MALKTNKWLPETYLRAINYGDTDLELYCCVLPDKNITGKKFIIKPMAEQFIQVKDLLPETVADPSLLNPELVSFSALNTDGSESRFNLFDEGPFKRDESVTYPSEMHFILALHEDALADLDFYTMKLLVTEPIPAEYASNKSFYTILCHIRGKIFRSLLRLAEADAAFEDGWADYAPEDRWLYCYDWAKVLEATLIYPESAPEQKQKAATKAIEIADRIKTLTQGMKFEKYHHLAADCLKAFLLCYLGQKDEALKLFSAHNFAQLPETDFMEDELSNFFSFIPYGFWVAIEMKNAELIRNLTGVVSAGFPGPIYEPNPNMCLRRALGNMAQKGRNQGIISINSLLDNPQNYTPAFPNLREFMRLTNAQDETALNDFIPYSKW